MNIVKNENKTNKAKLINILYYEWDSKKGPKNKHT